jgi:hypothetical protein
MALLQICWGVGEGELTVVQPPLDIEVGFDQVLIALTLTCARRSPRMPCCRKRRWRVRTVSG